MARIGNRKAPINGRLLRVALIFPGRNFTRERYFVRDTAIEALVLEDAQCDLSHVQPTPMLGCVMQLQLPGDPPRLSRLERFIQRRDLMRIEIVQHDTNHVSFWIAFVYQPLHFVSKVQLGTLLGHMHVPPASLWFDKEKEIPCAIAFVLIIKALWLSRLRWQWEPGLFDQLLVRFIKVDLGTSRIIGLRVDLQHVFHHRDKVGTHLRNTPLLLQPRLEVTFFKTRRTLSYE